MTRRKKMLADLDADIQEHLEREIEDNIDRGMSPQEARTAALRKFGNVSLVKEETREVWTVLWMQRLRQDVVYALRILRKSPAFTIVAVATLALAIGANAVVFSILNALILRPLDVPDAQSLYMIERTNETFGSWQSWPNYVDMRDRNRSFESLAAYNITQAVLNAGDHPTTGWVYEVTSNYFDSLGVRPHLGQFFHASDDKGFNSAPYVVLTYTYWHLNFKDDPSIVGRTVDLNKHPFTVLGVTPPGFHGTFLAFTPDFFVPIINREQIEGASHFEDRGDRWMFMMMGHLKPGVTPEQAVADLNSIGAYISKTYPKDAGKQTYTLARPGLIGDTLGRPVKAFVAGLMSLTALILLAACANLGSLFAARAADRSREVALRLALGATRARIMRQLLTEAVLIAIAGGTIGMIGSIYLLGALSAWQPFSRFPIKIPVNPDPTVYIVALLLALTSGLLFGAVPIRQVFETDPYDVVKSGSTGRPGRRITLRDVLIVAQIAICAVLVTSSMVALRGLERSLHSDYGINPDHRTLVQTELSTAGYKGEAVPVMQRRMVESMASIPGVQSVGLVNFPPLAMGAGTSTVFRDETAELIPSNSAARPFTFGISPDYFQAAGTALLAGRSVSWQDDKNQPSVAVINRTFANRIFGSVPRALGKYFKKRDGTRVQVVGVVADGKYISLTEPQESAVFYPILQSPSSESWFIVESNRDQGELVAALEAKRREMDASLSFYMQSWRTELNGSLFPARVATLALGMLGFIGAILSMTGIFGMSAYSISKRMKEFGIRMALGAQPRQVLQAALGRAVRLLSIGSAAGLILGLLATKVLAFIVYQATPRDPFVLTAVVIAMALLGVIATWIPAQRALAIDPLVLLREQ